jgi:uncharacterized membrane protein
LIIGLIFGTLQLIVLPPFQAVDEPVHFFRAFQIAEHGWVEIRTKDGIGGFLPTSVADVADRLSAIKSQPARKTTVSEIVNQLDATLARSQREFVDFRATALYTPLPYAPQAAAIALGEHFDIQPLRLFYLARAANLLCATIVTFIAIRLMPAMQWVSVLLALTPMALQQRASVSPDALTNALAVLLIAIAARCAFNRGRTVGAGTLAVLSALLIAMVLAKTYVAMPLLLCAVPAENWGGRGRRIRRTLFAVAACAVVFIAWALTIKNLRLPVTDAPNMVLGGEVADPAGLFDRQLMFVLGSPLKFGGVLRHTLQMFWRSYLETFIGRLGWGETTLPAWLIRSYLAALVIVAAIDGGGEVSFLSRLWMLLTFVVSSMIIAALLYCSWTPTAWPVVLGIQGRYFIPLAPLPFLALSIRRFRVDITALRLHWVIVAFVTVTFAVTLHVIVGRYYAGL